MAVYDEDRQRMVLVGGFDGAHSYRSTVWFLELQAEPRWHSIQVGGTSHEHSARAVYDPVRERVVVVEGSGGGYPARVSELSMRDPLSWQPLSPGGSFADMSYLIDVVYDDIADRMIVYDSYGDVYSLTWGDPLRRVRIAAQGPAPLAGRNVMRGVAHVIVFGEKDFDPGQIVETTIVVNGARVDLPGSAGARIQFRDSDRDGWNDAIMRVPTALLTLEGTSAGIRMDARMRDGQAIRGWTPYMTVGRDRVGTSYREAGMAAEPMLLPTTPSPAKGNRIEIHFALPTGALASLELIDVRGRRVSSVVLPAEAAGQQRYVVQPERSLVPGIYFVRLEQAGRASVRRIVVVE